MIKGNFPPFPECFVGTSDFTKHYSLSDSSGYTNDTPHVRGEGCSIELTCDFVFDGTELVMIEGTRDVVYIARVN